MPWPFEIFLMNKTIDCIVCGSCVVDLVCRPVALDAPIGAGALHLTEPVVLTGGGITSNAGITMARMGLSVSVLSFVGADAWGEVVRGIFRRDGVDDAMLAVHSTEATSTTVVVVDGEGERSFFHCIGAPETIDAAFMLRHAALYRQAKFLLLGYYSLMPNLERDLDRVLGEMRAAGCRTALDAAGSGGSMDPLEKLLPELDVYVPSFAEAKHQTGHDDPQRIIDTYRSCGAPGVVGVKLGTRGVLLSDPAAGKVHVEAVTPPGAVVDTTGAGDNFFAGLLAGLIRGLDLADAGRLGAAAAACCVTVVGGCAGGQDYAATRRLAGLDVGV